VTRHVPADSASLVEGATPSALPPTVAEPNNLLTIIGTITSQAALITGVLYYIGWARTNSLFQYFGVDPALVGFSTPDYVLRGGSDVVHGLWIYVAFAGALGLATIHHLVMVPALMSAELRSPPPSTNTTSESSSPNPSYADRSGLSWAIRLTVHSARVLGHWRPGVSAIRWFVRILRALAIALAATVLAGILSHVLGALLGLLLPLLLIFSVALLGYTAHIHSTYPNILAPRTPCPQPNRPSRVYPLTPLALGLIAGIWTLTLYGDRLGTRYATSLDANLAIAPEVIVYSTDRIALHGPGVSVAEIVQPGTKYHYQYAGLRFLAHPPDHFLLLPSKWRKGRDRTFLLRDNDSVRIDITAR
jgi:hypothetical protein